MLSPDSKWPSAASLLVPGDARDPAARSAVRLLGAHTYATSVSPRSSASTPAAVRAALARYSTWSFEDQVDLADAVVVEDRGDVAQPDTEEGAGELARELDDDRDGVPLWVLLGGDNALTWRAMTALSRGRLADWGLITFDAHLDMREGRSNGSPVRQLLESGLDGGHVVQIGLADFSNSAAYAGEAAAAGVRLVARSELRRRRLEEVVAEAVAIAGDGGRRVYVDVDMDVCDRAVVPGCPAAAPGGINADELRQLVRLTCADPRVAAIDVTEIDVARDAPDERTVRLGALVVLEALTGYLRRPSDQRSAE